MKSPLLTIAHIVLFLSCLCCIACERPMYDEEEAGGDDSRIPIKVFARSEGDNSIAYPAYIYAFDAEDGSYVNSCTIANENDEDKSLELYPDDYTIVAISGVGDSYDLPENPSMEDVITMKEEGSCGRAMMMGRSDVTVKSGKELSVKVTLYYTVTVVEASLSDIPAGVEKVRFRISPLYGAVNFKGEFSKEGEAAEVDCTKDDSGVWRAGPFYIFPGYGEQTSLSVIMEEGESSTTYSYTFDGHPEANVPFKVNGSYKGTVAVSGELIAGDWEDAKDVSFDFGPQAGDDATDDDDDTSSDTTELPEVGDVIENAIVVAIEEIEEGGHDVLMMNLDEWTTNAGGAETLLAEIQTDAWELPLKYEVNLLKANFGGDNLAEINELITAADEEHPTIRVGEERYLCENNGALRSFSFKEGSTIAALGSQKTYRVRLIRWVHYENE